MLKILLILGLAGAPEIYGGNALYPDQVSASAGGPELIQLEDDVPLEHGGSSGTADCWQAWFTAGTDHFGVVCTNVDGIGTNGYIYSVDDGTDDVVFIGDITAANATLAAAGELSMTGRGIFASPTANDFQLFNTGKTASMLFETDVGRWLPNAADTDTHVVRTTTDVIVIKAGNQNLLKADASGAYGFADFEGGVSFLPHLQTLGAGDPVLRTRALVRVVSDGGAVTLTSTPTIDVTSVDDGALLIIQGTSNTDTVILQSEGQLANSDLVLANDQAWTSTLGATLAIVYDDANTDKWYEIARSDASGHNGFGVFTNSNILSETLTFQGGGGDASKTTTGNMLADGFWVTHVTGRVVTAGTTCTSMDIGDGVDVDLFGNIAVTDTTTFDTSDATANWNNPQIADANDEITITGVGGNCVDLVVDLYVHYSEGTAATSD